MQVTVNLKITLWFELSWSTQTTNRIKNDSCPEVIRRLNKPSENSFVNNEDLYI